MAWRGVVCDRAGRWSLHFHVNAVADRANLYKVKKSVFEWWLSLFYTFFLRLILQFKKRNTPALSAANILLWGEETIISRDEHVHPRNKRQYQQLWEQQQTLKKKHTNGFCSMGETFFTCQFLILILNPMQHKHAIARSFCVFPLVLRVPVHSTLKKLRYRNRFIWQAIHSLCHRHVACLLVTRPSQLIATLIVV